MEVNGIDLEQYKKHPRVLEIRFINLFDMFEREYGYAYTMKIYESVANAFNCNMIYLQALINNRFEVKKCSKANYKRWRQEVIFAANCYGETSYKVAKYYLNVTPSAIYNHKDVYDIETFLDDNWLLELDNSVDVCGAKAYRVEITRFLEIIDEITDVLIRWRGSK